MLQTFGLARLLDRQKPEHQADTIKVWRIAVFVTLAIGLAKHVPLAVGLAGLAAAAAQLYIPLRYALSSAEGDDGIGYGFAGLRRDLPLLVGILLITCIPFWFLHEAWWTWLGAADGSGSQLALPGGDIAPWIEKRGSTVQGLLTLVAAFELIAVHTLGVALPEELFYRGFLQPKLCRSFEDKPLGMGLVWNHGIALAAGLFALAHFLGEYNPARLGPFIPALLFGILRRRSGSIASAVILHAAFNIFAALLYAGIALR
jgi:membrane protease YdiL (CAAX protease family)